MAVPCATALVFAEQLPLAESSIDRMMMVHMLEHAENPSADPEGGLAGADAGRKAAHRRCPTGGGSGPGSNILPSERGAPFPRGSLSRLLRDALLTPVAWSDALNFPPVTRPRLLRLHSRLEKIGRRVWPVFAGVILVEATKRLVSGNSRRRPGRRGRFWFRSWRRRERPAYRRARKRLDRA